MQKVSFNLLRNITNNDIFSFYCSPGIVFGTFIGLCNLSNVKRSPVYNRNNFGFNDALRFGALISMKSFIYGTFYPFAMAGIIFDLHDKQEFEKHLVPFSRAKF